MQPLGPFDDVYMTHCILKLHVAVSTDTIASAEDIQASEENLPHGPGYEISAIQSAFRFISESEELPRPFSFALELNSLLLLTNCQLDTLFPNNDKIEEHQKSMKNYRILRVVQENITEDPQKFMTLCIVFKKLGCRKCLLKLTKGICQCIIATTIN